MKIFANILAIIIFGLSILPCADKGSCSDLESFQVADHAHEKEKPSGEHCSPLCFCSCCNTVTTHFTFKLLDEILQFEYFQLEKIGFRLPIVTTPYYPIWHPPQLV